VRDIKIPELLLTLSKDSRACCGKTDTEISQEMLWNGSLKKNWLFCCFPQDAFPRTNKYSEASCTEISLDNKLQTHMILKSKRHNTYREIGSIIKIEHYMTSPRTC